MYQTEEESPRVESDGLARVLTPRSTRSRPFCTSPRPAPRVIPVGHRALVAIERADGRYDCHYAHWGAHEWRLLAALQGADDPRDCDGVDPAPIATDVSFGSVVDTHLDFRTHEALYRAERDSITPYTVCWFGFPAVDERVSDAGALVAVDRGDARADGALVRGWFTGTKGLLGAMLDDGDVTPDAARDWLVSRLQSWAGDRETLFGPGVTGEGDGS